MSVVQAIKCNVCGRLQRESNHWFKYAVWQRILHLWPAVVAEPRFAKGVDVKDACGRECIGKAFEDYLARGTKGS